MKGVRKFRDRLTQDLKHKEFKKAFDEEDIFARLAIEIARIREQEGITQQELARRLHTSQQMVSRLESPRNKSLSVMTLLKIAQALHKKLDFRFK